MNSIINVTSEITLPCSHQHNAQHYVRLSKALCSGARDSSVRWMCAFNMNYTEVTQVTLSVR